MLPLATAFGILALKKELVLNPLQHTHSLALFALSVGLLIYFWYWDTENPGLKEKYSHQAFIVNVAAVSLLFCFLILFILVDLPAYFMSGVSLVYFAKTLLNGVSSKHIGDEADYILNVLAVYSDAVSCVVFAAYSIFSNLFILDKTDMTYLNYIVIICFITVIAFEAYYQVVARAVNRLTSNNSGDDSTTRT